MTDSRYVRVQEAIRGKSFTSMPAARHARMRASVREAIATT
jgi:hypothetical protein